MTKANVLLIAGHGAGDPGAMGNGYKEADLTRELVNLIASRLRKYATVDIYNQNRNAFNDVQNGTFKIGAYHYALEIHFNAFNGNAHGTECYVTSREAGITVEQAIMKGLGKFFTLRDNDSIFDGVKRTNFLVINTLKNKGISGALLETCFIDNAQDMKVYQANKNTIADTIVNGIVEGFGLTANSGGSKPSNPAPKPQAKKLYLPASATSWRVYPTNKAPVVGNECGYLYPSKFGGLTYDILATPQTNVVTIQTRDYGRVNIFVAPSTGAVIK